MGTFIFIAAFLLFFAYACLESAGLWIVAVLGIMATAHTLLGKELFDKVFIAALLLPIVIGYAYKLRQFIQHHRVKS